MVLKLKKNKITIYLIKKGKDALKDSNCVSLPLNGKGTLHYSSSDKYKPKWVSSFFNPIPEINVYNQNSKGLLLKEIDIGKNEVRTFALTFGYGHSMLEKINCEEDFGLKLLLNIVDSDSIRKIGIIALSSPPKNTVEQLSKVGHISDFGIDIEQDLVEEITGKVKEDLKDKFSKNQITGKMSFTISREVNIDNIDDFLKTCYDYFQKDNYKENFSFIDQIKCIKDDENLNKQLITKIKDNSNTKIKLWMAIPEIILWEEIKGFSFNGKKESLVSDITYDNFKKSLGEQNKNINIKNININTLKNKKITAFKNDDQEYINWSAFKCIYCEITENEKTHILTNGKWYRIDQEFVEKINKKYKEVIAESKKSNISFISASKDQHEPKYNKRLADDIEDAVLMDGKIITYGGGYSKIEFCDVYDQKRKRIIHIKTYSGSSTLSHLFSQGKVSGELFKDKEFRKKVKEKEKEIDFDDKLKVSDFTIIFGIISKSNKLLNLPFFSKVNFINTKKLLNNFGFPKVYLINIKRAK